jgi:hypothetical protein
MLHYMRLHRVRCEDRARAAVPANPRRRFAAAVVTNPRRRFAAAVVTIPRRRFAAAGGLLGLGLGPSLVACVLLLLPGVAQAWTLQMPLKAEFATLPQGRVLCGPVPDGFSIDSSRRRMRPKPDAWPGLTAYVSFAQHTGACATDAQESATLVVTGEHPTIDPSSVTLALDAGRLDVHGSGLEGVRIGWSADGKNGSDVCLGVTRDRDRDVCALNLDKSLPADPQRIELRWAPPLGRIERDTLTYDKRGEPVLEEQLRLPIARLVVARMFPDAPAVNVASGEGKVALVHPEAVSGAECGAVRCDVVADGLLVGSVPAAAASFSVRLRLRPRVFLQRGESLESSAAERLTVLRCPMELASGEPLRSIDELRVLLRLSPECVGDVNRLRWTANGDPAEVLTVESHDNAVFALIRVGRIVSDRIAIVASREDGSVLAVVSSPTGELPPLMATLALPNYGTIEFIPRNRDAIVTVTHVGGKGRLVPVSVPGAYKVDRQQDGFHLRGTYGAGGYAALRFAYRIEGLPGGFSDIDFAEINDPVQRPIREASVPVPIGGSSMTDKPVIELYCSKKPGELQLMAPGLSHHIPFDMRDSCRLVIHRERIPREAGEQRLDVDVTVTAVGGEQRPEGHMTHRLLLRSGQDRDVVWLRGAKQQFDRITIQATHVVNEDLLMSETGRHISLPSSQWAVVTEDADFKFYATAAIPASLYRFSGDRENLGTGPLSLNFGVLSRLTWLDSEGHEGLVGLEAGVMGMGLAIDTDRQLAIVAGLGIAIPLGNANQPAQAAINIHAWLSYSVGEHTAEDEDGSQVVLSPWAFVFGPSITVGNIGAFL